MAAGLGLVAVVAILVLVALWALQRHLLYVPVAQVPPSETVGLLRTEDASFNTQDGVTLGGWFVPAERRPSPFTILVFNGNAGNRSFRAPLAAALSHAGLSVLLFDYRGYGGNPGRPSESGLACDARAARTYLEGRQDVDPERIVYFGESLGSGVAVILATERPPAALILRSPYTSMVEVARRHYPFLPVRHMLSDRYLSIERIRRISCPLLVIAGDHDRVVPVEQSRRLYEAAPGPKRLVIVPGADHNDYALLAGDRLIEEVSGFLATVGPSHAQP